MRKLNIIMPYLGMTFFTLNAIVDVILFMVCGDTYHLRGACGWLCAAVWALTSIIDYKINATKSI